MSNLSKRFFWLSIGLTVLHLIGSSYYPYLYAYFNGLDQAGTFATISTLLRLIFLCWLAFCGYRGLREQQRLTWLYVALFFVNLICPYFFT